MRIVPDGIYYACGLALAGFALSYWLSPWLGIPAYLLAAFCLYFFRDPERVAPPGNVVVSPADGKVVGVRQLPDGRVRISVFLNIFNVHVNRAPIDGTVRTVDYHQGKFLVASRELASSDNEQNTLTVEGQGSQVVFSQIAGLIARRIVCWKHAGDRLKRGERIGLIKFGSRVDVVLGPEWTIKIASGHKVKAGISVLAEQSGRS